MGIGLKRQVADAFDGKKIDTVIFRGSMAAENPDAIYEPTENTENQKSNKQAFINRRSQYYWRLRDRIYKTFRAVTDNKYENPDDLISFDSGIKNIAMLRAEICRIPQKANGTGRLQIMTKKEMKTLGIASPNMADSVMMAMVETKAAITFDLPMAMGSDVGALFQ